MSHPVVSEKQFMAFRGSLRIRNTGGCTEKVMLGSDLVKVFR